MSSSRANALATRLEQGAAALARLASSLTDSDWATRMPHDGRTLGVIVHHVASQYVIEMQLAGAIAAGKAIEGVTMADVDQINAKHAAEFSGATKAESLDLLSRNSAAAAAAIRALSDEQLDRAVPISLYADAPLTCQFFLEDHPVRHSYHHLALIQRVVLQPALAR
jgi:Mycothiol maleylpyruvate isomerase N-terminal domain